MQEQFLNIYLYLDDVSFRSANIQFLIIDFTFYSPTNIGITFNTVRISKYLEINYKTKVYIYT